MATATMRVPSGVMSSEIQLALGTFAGVNVAPPLVEMKICPPVAVMVVAAITVPVSLVATQWYCWAARPGTAAKSSVTGAGAGATGPCPAAGACGLGGAATTSSSPPPPQAASHIAASATRRRLLFTETFIMDPHRSGWARPSPAGARAQARKCKACESRGYGAEQPAGGAKPLDSAARCEGAAKGRDR